MNADAFRYLYNYHFSENRKIWDNYVMSLTQEQFTQDVNYSIGSVRNQLVHLMSVDYAWFCDLRGIENPQFFDPDEFNDREKMRLQWNDVEQHMRDYLVNLRDDMLFEKPFREGEDKDLILWQVLLHVCNHGTDHRAQILRLLNDLGLKTGPQDLVFYVYDNYQE